MPLKETFNCDHNNRCPPGSRARREPAGATSPTGTGAIGTEAEHRPQARKEQSTAPATPRRQHTRPREQRHRSQKARGAPRPPPPRDGCNAPTQRAFPIPREKKSDPESKTLTLSIPGLFYGTFGRNPYVAPPDTLRLPVYFLARRGPELEEFNSELNSTRAPLTKRRRDLIVRTPTVQDIVREAAGYLPGACRRTTDKGDKMPLKETFNCDHNNRCPPGSRARREPAGVTSPTGTGTIGTEALHGPLEVCP
ncbi:hypothetical protein Bbelb_082170 [Branchiostoma belcheri]|nr:hypothetical protein Bbelb_082170 [Branchiostoma belcheri]